MNLIPCGGSKKFFPQLIFGSMGTVNSDDHCNCLTVCDRGFCKWIDALNWIIDRSFLKSKFLGAGLFLISFNIAFASALSRSFCPDDCSVLEIWSWDGRVAEASLFPFDDLIGTNSGSFPVAFASQKVKSGALPPTLTWSYFEALCCVGSWVDLCVMVS